MASLPKDKKKNIVDGPVCDNCGDTERDMKLCARCKLVSYCSKECQVAGWKGGHKELCIAVEDRKPSSSSAAADPTHNNGVNISLPSSPLKNDCPECAICLSAMTTPKTTCEMPCKHKFHPDCMKTFRSYAEQTPQLCPLCRNDLPPGPEQSFIDGLRLHHEYRNLPKSSSDEENRKNKMNKIIELFKCAAEEGGDKRAQGNLGIIYSSNEGIDIDYKESFKWYLLAAEQELVQAQQQIGLYYYHGQGIEKNENQAVEYFMKGSKQGYAESQYYLGLCYTNGSGIEKDFKKAMILFEKAMEQGHAETPYFIGTLHRIGFAVEKSEKKAFEWFLKAAKLGHSHSQYIVSLKYKSGENGVKQNPKTCVEWCLKAANQKHADAQYLMGCIYAGGYGGIERNLNKATEWNIKAAENGNIEAIMMAASHCQSSNDNVKAFYWYKQAAKQGNTEAMHSIGIFYQYSLGVRCDLKKAAQWWLKAARLGNEFALHDLECWYETGEVVGKNLKKAKEMILKSAAKGYQPAIDKLKTINY